MLAAVVAEGVVLALLVVLLAGLLRSHAEILRGLRDLGVDLDPDRAAASAARAPAGAGVLGHDIAGTGTDGEALSVGVLGASHTTLLVFLSSGCHTCLPFWDTLRAGAPAPAGARVVVVVRDPGEEDPARVRALAGPDLAVVMSTRAWRDYRVPGSPHVVCLQAGSGTVVGEGTAATWAQVLDLLGEARDHRSSHRRGVPAGRDNPARVDAELSAAGIGPGDTRLYPSRRDR